MQGKKPNKDQQAYLYIVAQVGCIACILYHDQGEAFGQGYCEIHHTNGSNNHEEAIGLCDKHHRKPDNQNPKRWISRHGDGHAAFKERYGTDEALLMCQKDLNDKFKGMSEI